MSGMESGNPLHHGYNTEQHVIRQLEEQSRTMKEMYEGGATMKQLADHFRMSTFTIRARLRSQGVIPHKPGPKPRPPASAYPPNPWAGQRTCTLCGSDEHTMPYDRDDKAGPWRCVACRRDL